MFQPCHSCLAPLPRHLLPRDVPKAGHTVEPHTVLLVCTAFHGVQMQKTKRKNLFWLKTVCIRWIWDSLVFETGTVCPDELVLKKNPVM